MFYSFRHAFGRPLAERDLDQELLIFHHLRHLQEANLLLIQLPGSFRLGGSSRVLCALFGAQTVFKLDKIAHESKLLRFELSRDTLQLLLLLLHLIFQSGNALILDFLLILDTREFLLTSLERESYLCIFTTQLLVVQALFEGHFHRLGRPLARIEVWTRIGTCEGCLHLQVLFLHLDIQLLVFDLPLLQFAVPVLEEGLLLIFKSRIFLSESIDLVLEILLVLAL